MGALPAAAPAPWGPAPPAPMEGDAPWKVMPCQPTTQSYSHQEIHREFLAHLKLNLFKPINSLFIGNSCRAWNSADALQLPPSPSPGIKPPSTTVLLSSWGCCGGGGSACTGCCPPPHPHMCTAGLCLALCLLLLLLLCLLWGWGPGGVRTGCLQPALAQAGFCCGCLLPWG